MGSFCNICGQQCGMFSRKQTADGIVCNDCLEKAKVTGSAEYIRQISVDQIKGFMQDPNGFEKYVEEYNKKLAVQREAEAKKHAEFIEKKRLEEEQAKILAHKSKLDQFGLDVSSYSDDKIRELNAQSAANIADGLSLSKVWSFGSSFLDDSSQNFTIQMAKVQVEQNWMLIRQNEQIIRLLQKLIDDQDRDRGGQEK